MDGNGTELLGAATLKDVAIDRHSTDYIIEADGGDFIDAPMPSYAFPIVVTLSGRYKLVKLLHL